MKAYFPKIDENDKNVTVAFRYTPDKNHENLELHISASNAFGVFSDGKLIFRGPIRSAHGYSHVSNVEFRSVMPTCIVIEVAYYGINGFAYVDEPPFLAAELVANGEIVATAADFEAFRLTDRVQKVPRYSFQRAFSESYVMQNSREALYRGLPVRYPRLSLAETEGNTLTPCDISLPILSPEPINAVIERGHLGVNPTPHFFRDRCIVNIGEKLKGYPFDTLESFPPDEVAALAFIPDKCGDYDGRLTDSYALFDCCVNRTAFIGLIAEVEKSATVYVIFDEILWNEGASDPEFAASHPQGALPLSFYRMECCNIVKYDLSPGKYDLLSFEPYTFRYLKVIVKGSATISRVYRTPYENPDAERTVFNSSDAAINEIFEAGKRTFVQNAVDVLTDCPSRERAGWLCDSYFTARAERLLTGKNAVECNLLDCYRLAPESPFLPPEMPAMCYPADHNDGVFIPNWAMFLIVELKDYLRRTGDETMTDGFRDKIARLLDYFSRYENEYGLLENLPGWVFVEWSDCSKFLTPVNIPTNMLYALALEAAADLYGDDSAKAKAEAIKNTIRALAFDGEFFEDNLVRENGKLVRAGNVTETCQYYAFFTGVANKADYPALFETVLTSFGPLRSADVYPNIPRSNAFIGNFLRLETLDRYGEEETILREFTPYFGRMSERTGTLWENNDPHASCCHGFASYICVLYAKIAFGYLDFDETDKTIILRENFRLSGSARFPVPGGFVSIEITNVTRAVSIPDGYELKIVK